MREMERDEFAEFIGKQIDKLTDKDRERIDYRVRVQKNITEFIKSIHPYTISLFPTSKDRLVEAETTGVITETNEFGRDFILPIINGDIVEVRKLARALTTNRIAARANKGKKPLDMLAILVTEGTKEFPKDVPYDRIVSILDVKNLGKQEFEDHLFEGIQDAYPNITNKVTQLLQFSS